MTEFKKMQEIQAELLRISEKEGLDFCKEDLSDLFEETRSSEALRVLVCGETNASFYTKTAGRLLGLPKQSSLPICLERDGVTFNVLPSGTDTPLTMELLNQQDRMIFITRAPQALGRSGLTFLAKCGGLRPVVLLMDTDRLEPDELDEYKSSTLGLIRSIGFKPSQLVFPVDADFEKVWSDVVSEMESADKAAMLDEHRSTALFMLQQEMLADLREKLANAEKLETERAKESQHNARAESEKMSRIMLQIESESMSDIREMSAYAENKFAERRSKDVASLCQAFKKKCTSFWEMNTDGLEEILLQQMKDLMRNISSNLENTMRVQIAEWNKLCGDEVCRWSDLNNDFGYLYSCQRIKFGNETLVFVTPSGPRGVLLSLINALRKDLKMTLSVFLGSAVSIALLPKTAPIVALLDLLFATYQNRELKREQICQQLAVAWDYYADNIRQKLCELVDEKYKLAVKVYNKFCQARMENATTLVDANKASESIAQSIARCEGMDI